MKLHLGCGLNVKPGYVNIDAYVDADGVMSGNILDLPYENESVREILAEHLVEHLSFVEEKLFFHESLRLLEPGGKLRLEVPDMEWLCQMFLDGEDRFTDFYQVGSEDHYFGNGRDETQRWGIKTTHFWGNQNGTGQFHRNGYTQKKLESIAKLCGFRSITVQKNYNKGAQVLIAEYIK